MYRPKKSKMSCYDKALYLLGRRAHSCAELERKLYERDYPEEEIDSVLERLLDSGMLDDSAYALRQTQLMFENKGFAPRRIAQELRRCGVDREDIDYAIGALDDYDSEETIDRLLEGKFAKNLDTEQGRRRTANALARMGYSWSEIRRGLDVFEA